MVDRISLDHADIDSEEKPRHNSKKQSVHEADLHLFHNKHKLLLCGQFLIHKHTDRNSQRLCSDVSCHVEDQGLETHDDRDHGNDRLKSAHNGRYYHAQE